MRKSIIIKSLTFILSIMISIGFFSSSSEAASKSKDSKAYLAMGSTSSTSGVYAFAVGIAAAINKYDPGIINTVVESGGSYDNAKRMKEGIFNWSSSGSPAVYSHVRNGTGKFEKAGAWEPVRLMFLRSVNVSRVYVRADIATKENITNWSDLSGKKFAPGIPGTRDMSRAMEVDKILKSGIKFIPSSLSDAIRALKEGRIVGVLKGSPSNRFDAAVMECHYGNPLTVIGFSEDQAKRIQEINPLNTFMKTPVGSIENAPEAGDFWEMNSSVMTQSSSEMSQEIGYRIMKAVYKGWKEIGEAYAPCKTVDPIADAFKSTPSGPDFLFHAGVVQFAKEIGIDVPQRLIPPEYQEIK